MHFYKFNSVIWSICMYVSLKTIRKIFQLKCVFIFHIHKRNMSTCCKHQTRIHLPRFMFFSKFVIFCSMSSNFCWSSSMLSEWLWCNSWCCRWMGSIRCLGSKFPASSSGDLYVISNSITIYKQINKKQLKKSVETRKTKQRREKRRKGPQQAWNLIRKLKYNPKKCSKKINISIER